MAAYEQQRGAGSRARGGGGGGGGRWGGDRQRGGRKEEDSTSIWGNDWDVDAPAESEGRSGGSWQDREERSGGSWQDREGRSGGSWRGGEERSGGGSWRSNEERGTSSWRGGDRQRSDRRGDGRGEGWGNRDRRSPRGGDRSQQQRYGGDRSQQRYGGERGERRDRWQGREQQAAGGRGAGGYRQAWGEADGAEGSWGEEAAGAAGAPAGAGGLRQFWIGDVLYGVSPVLAALQAGRREVHTLYLQDGMDLSKRKVGFFWLPSGARQRSAVQLPCGACDSFQCTTMLPLSRPLDGSKGLGTSHALHGQKLNAEHVLSATRVQDKGANQSATS